MCRLKVATFLATGCARNGALFTTRLVRAQTRIAGAAVRAGVGSVRSSRSAIPGQRLRNNARYCDRHVPKNRIYRAVWSARPLRNGTMACQPGKHSTLAVRENCAYNFSHTAPNCGCSHFMWMVQLWAWSDDLVLRTRPSHLQRLIPTCSAGCISDIAR